MKIYTRTATALCFAWAVLAGDRLYAGDATWNQTGGTHDWTNAVNWLPSTTYPNGAGQTASITNDITAPQTINLRKNITLGTLNIGDTVNAANNYGTILNNKSGESFVLSFDSSVAGTAAMINTGKLGTPKLYLNAPMSLASDLLVNLGGTDSANSPYLYFGAIMDMNGHTVAFTNGVVGQVQVNIDTAADFAGIGTIINNSRVSVAVNGSKAFGGTLIANTSSFGLTAGGFTNAAECVVNGWISNTTTQLGGSLNSGSGSAYASNPGQRLTRHRITFNGGTLLANGQQGATNTLGVALWQDWVRDDVDVMDFKSGYNHVYLNKQTLQTGTVVYVNTVLRSRGASLFFFGKDSAMCNFHAANASNFLIGASGPVGSTTMSIVPWMGVSLSGGTTTPAGFATFEEPIGFRELAGTEYTNSVTAGATCNVHLTGAFAPNGILTTDTTINALRLAGNNVGGNIGSNKTLTITSGGLFFTGSTSTLGTSGNTNAGTINFGAAEGVVSVHGINVDTIGAKIMGTGGLTKANTGTLTLTGANSYSGTNHISGGILRVGDGTYTSNLGSGNVEVHAGAMLKISCSNAVADTATVKLYNTGPNMFYGKMQLDSGMNETVRELYFGDVGMPAGTYGSSTSSAPAANQNDHFFSGTGVLTVTHSAGGFSKGTMVRFL
jgi:autotransporter-associated beta strand protein